MYMIGNPDFSVSGRHNVKVLGLPGFGTEGYTAVPYDFDYTGLVNAMYAVPGENLGISSVRERYFLGLCRNDEAMVEALEHINQYREEILQVVNSCDYLEEGDKKEMILYLEDYFALATDYDVIGPMLERTCR